MLHQAGGLEGLWGGGKEQMRGDKGQRSGINNCCKSCSHGEALQQVAIQHATTIRQPTSRHFGSSVH